MMIKTQRTIMIKTEITKNSKQNSQTYKLQESLHYLLLNSKMAVIRKEQAL